MVKHKTGSADSLCHQGVLAHPAVFWSQVVSWITSGQSARIQTCDDIKPRMQKFPGFGIKRLTKKRCYINITSDSEFSDEFKNMFSLFAPSYWAN
jgi:hypothetical protein